MQGRCGVGIGREHGDAYLWPVQTQAAERAGEHRLVATVAIAKISGDDDVAQITAKKGAHGLALPWKSRLSRS